MGFSRYFDSSGDVRFLLMLLVVGKLGGGLREGPYRDPVTMLWKQKIPRVTQSSVVS